MDVTYNNVLESTRQYFQGVPPAASGLSHAGQHPAGGAHALFNTIQQGSQQQPNGSNYYHHQQALHPQAQQLQQQSLQQHQQQQHQPQPQQQPQQQQHPQQRHPPAQQQQPQSQPVPSYLTNGGIGAAGKNMYPPQPSPSPQESLRIPQSAASKNHYNNHPNPSPSPQEHRLPTGNASKSMYSPHPQPSPSPQDHVRLPSMSPFSNLPYQNQMQGATRNRHTPTSASPLPPISQLKAPPASPSPAAAAAGYQRQVNGAASHYGSNSGYYHPSYSHQSLLQQQRDLQQQHQQLQQQLHQQQQEELKQHLQQQAFYSTLTNSSQQHQSAAHQAQLQRRTPTQYPQNSQTPSRSPAASAAVVNLSRTPSNATNNANSAAAIVKRESPLDLSVKTVRQSADSTGQMENNSSSESSTTYYYFQQEGVRGPLPLTNNQQQNSYQSYATLQPATTPKVDFSPNFSQHAHSLHNHQQQQQQQQHHQPQVQQHHPQPQHQASHLQPAGGRGQAAHHPHQLIQSHQQLLDKRWKDQFQVPQAASVLKTAPPASNPPAASVPGTSGNVNHLSSHYHVNQFGQSLPKPAYPQEPSRYPQNYLKRPPSVDHSKVSAPTPPKQPRHDNWKATIDQQIEKRFNSYLSSKGIVNGDVGRVATSTPSPAPAPAASYPMPGRNFAYDHQQGPSPHPQQQHGFSAEKGSHHPPSSGVAGNGAADKRVLSILRNSLETKEARLQQQQMVKSPLQYTELTSRPAASAQHLFAAQHRQSLPAFQGFSAAHERITPSAFPRLSIPKAVDSIQEHHKNSSYLGAIQHLQHLPPSMHLQGGHAVPRQHSGRHPEVVDISSEDESAGLGRLLHGPKAASTPLPTTASNHAGAPSPALPTSKSGEFDGLAAFLAARIRTKAELKQQLPPDQPPTPGSSSLASASLSSGNFRSPYNNDLVKTPHDMSSTSKCSPWTSSHKMTKDQPLSAAFPRRRLFSKGEEEHPSGDAEAPFPPATASLPPRASSSHRSSSETSVFDFRESDSEGETPTLERQPGRRPSISSVPPGGAIVQHQTQQQQQQPPPHKEVIFPPTPLEEELKPVDEDTYEDWLGYVDDLLGQLEKDRLKRLKSQAKKPSTRGVRGGGRGAGTGDRAPSAASETKPSLPPPVAIKQEVQTDAEESSSSFATPHLAATSSAKIKEEPISETEFSPTKDLSQIRVASEVKTEPKEKQRASAGKRGGRGRGRGGGPGSRGGRGGRTKKAVFGDGSDFRTPGWEEELYKFKKSLRMPARLINISRPPGWPKAPLSLPDLEAYPDSPCTNDSMETFPGKSKIEKDDKKANEEDKKSIAKSLGEDQSFLDRLMAKYTARKKKSKKESPTKPDPKAEGDAPELLPTPSLHGSNKDPSLLGFRKETIAEYRAEFLKTGTFTAEADLPPTILVTRTRTENKLFKERLTIKEVFGAERPASAPPPGTTTDDLRRRQRLRTDKQKEKKKRMMVRAKKENLQQNSGPGQGKNKTFRTFRRKLKSSGFDYIRKPKKKVPGPKKDSDHPHKPRKKKVQPMTEEEIEDTIKSWTLNKGIGETVLHRAAKNGLLDVVRHLVDKLEQDPSPRDNAGYTPLHEACSRGHVAVAQLLLNYGASVEDSALGGVRPLHEAAENGFTKVVRLLLDYGADPLLATYSGATALSLAAAEEESRLLMEHHISQNGSIASSVHDDIASVPKEASLDNFEIEESDFPLPTLYRLSGESRVDSWVLFHELAPHVKVKTKEAFVKLLKADTSTVIREIKLHDFFAKAHSRAIKSAPPTECPNKTPKLTLVKYTDEVKELLGVETTTIPR